MLKFLILQYVSLLPLFKFKGAWHSERKSKTDARGPRQAVHRLVYLIHIVKVVVRRYCEGGLYCGDSLCGLCAAFSNLI
jgi:hypothetical protein